MVGHIGDECLDEVTKGNATINGKAREKRRGRQSRLRMPPSMPKSTKAPLLAPLARRRTQLKDKGVTNIEFAIPTLFSLC